MRVKTVILVIITSVILIFIFESCSLLGTTKEERIARFESDLNNNRGYIYQNFLDSVTTDYDAIKNPILTWDVWFPEGTENYEITITDSSVDPVTATIDGPDIFGGPMPIEFKMVKDDFFNWYIEELTLNDIKIVD